MIYHSLHLKGNDLVNRGFELKEIRFIIKSKLEYVALVGMSVKKICSLTSFSEKQVFLIELCVVEAINNSIIHAYKGESIYEVELSLSINKDHLFLKVSDKGKPMGTDILENTNPISISINRRSDDPLKLSETGRGLGLIKETMDKVTYGSDTLGNHLTMIKYF